MNVITPNTAIKQTSYQLSNLQMDYNNALPPTQYSQNCNNSTGLKGHFNLACGSLLEEKILALFSLVEDTLDSWQNLGSVISSK